MKQSVIEEIFLKIFPFSGNEEYKELYDELQKLLVSLHAEEDQHQTESVSKLGGLLDDLIYVATRDSFKFGFKKGVLLGTECIEAQEI